MTGLQWDADGKPFIRFTDGRPPMFVSPSSVSQDPAIEPDQRLREWAKANAFQGGGLFRGREQWNSDTGTKSRPINWGNIASIGVGAGIAAPYVAPLFAGSGSAAAPGAQVGNLNATIDSLMAGGGGLGTTTTATTAGAGSIIDRVKRALTDPATVATAGTAIASMLGNRGGGDYDSEIAANQDQLRRLQAITEARMRRVDPLHQAATQLAFGRLPVSSRNGLTLTNTPLPE